MFSLLTDSFQGQIQKVLHYMTDPDMEYRPSGTPAEKVTSSRDVCSAKRAAILHTAVEYCIECKQAMCDQCLSFHGTIAATKQHKTVPVGARKDVIAKNTCCEKHPDKLVEVYCNDCSVAGCMRCFLQHKQHNCSDIDDIAAQKRQELTTDGKALGEM